MTVHDDENGTDDTAGAAAELRTWLTDVPRLRGRVDRVDRSERDDRAEQEGGAPARTMGPAVDALVAVLEPGGVAAVFAGALVAWLQTRRSSHTISVTRPDGTRITLSSRQARALSPQEAADLAERLARPPADGTRQGDADQDDGDGDTRDGDPSGSRTT
ncbi:effector-associated constant component EACC1 [Streptomyces atrovirens]|uniref:effector-associated constant component EACC1 n=1 Tax=Streptomyces atrovirens TaxID=285556 RepID=UPI0031E0560B